MKMLGETLTALDCTIFKITYLDIVPFSQKKARDQNTGVCLHKTVILNSFKLIPFTSQIRIWIKEEQSVQNKKSLINKNKYQL